MEADVAKTALQMKDLIGLEKEPVTVTFKSEVPTDVPRYDGRDVPSGCSFWVEGRESTFYTVAEQHFNCPIGTLTQGFSIPEERMEEAQGFFGLLVENQYVSNDELEGVPKIKKTPAAIVYGPLSKTTSEPDVVLVMCDARQAMLLSEAVGASGLGGFPQLMGKPTCAAIPLSLDVKKPTLSLGCIGNRVYTGLGDHEMVVTVPGNQIRTIVENLTRIVATNELLEGAHTRKK